MMMINYNDHPFLLFFSQNSKSSFDELIFQTSGDEANHFLENSKGWSEMFAFASSMNTFYKKDCSTNYWVTPETLDLYYNDKKKRYHLFHDFMKSDIQTQFGTLLFPHGGQFVYIVMGKPETRALKHLKGNYLCVARFQSNYFNGFEESTIVECGELDEPTHFFSDDEEGENPATPGSYLAFLIVLLAYAQEKAPLQLYQSPKIKEAIYIL